MVSTALCHTVFGGGWWITGDGLAAWVQGQQAGLKTGRFRRLNPPLAIMHVMRNNTAPLGWIFNPSGPICSFLPGPRQSGRSSGVEHNLAKVGVVSSNLIARSNFPTSEALCFCGHVRALRSFGDHAQKPPKLARLLVGYIGRLGSSMLLSSVRSISDSKASRISS